MGNARRLDRDGGGFPFSALVCWGPCQACQGGGRIRHRLGGRSHRPQGPRVGLPVCWAECQPPGCSGQCPAAPLWSGPVLVSSGVHLTRTGVPEPKAAGRVSLGLRPISQAARHPQLEPEEVPALLLGCVTSRRVRNKGGLSPTGLLPVGGHTWHIWGVYLSTLVEAPVRAKHCAAVPQTLPHGAACSVTGTFSPQWTVGIFSHHLSAF